MSRIFKNSESVFDAVDAVVKYGYAAVEGTKTPAMDYCTRILKNLTAYPAIVGQIFYLNVPKQGYLYFVFDTKRFTHSTIHPLIVAIDQKSRL